MKFDCTPSEEALLGTLEGELEIEDGKRETGNRGNGEDSPSSIFHFQFLKGKKVLVAGSRSELLPCALAKAGAEVTVHAFDMYHARAIKNRIDEARLGDSAKVRCTPYIPEGPYARAYFMATPLSMTGELILDQLEDVRSSLASGGKLFAAIEGDAGESLKTMKKVFARVHVLATQSQSRRKRRRGELSLFRVVKGEKDAAAKRRNFACDWPASVPGGETRIFTSLPGCFCHRRADVGGLSLAETACAIPGFGETAKGGKVEILDMGCGCGFVGLLVADWLRARGAVADLTLLDSHARAVEAAKANAERLGFMDVRFVLADDGLPPDDNARYDLFLGNPPYYGDWQIAETFIATAFKVLKPGGRCLTVAKNEGGLAEIQSRIFGRADTIRRRGYCVFSSIHP